jgi:hypothetical protein
LSAAIARLLEWEIAVPSPDDVIRAARSVHDAGYAVGDAEDGVRLTGPWGTVVRLHS